MRDSAARAIHLDPTLRRARVRLSPSFLKKPPKMKLLSSLVLSALLCAPLAAQACSDLSVSGGSPGTNLDFALTGAPANAPSLLVIGTTLGSTTINLGPVSFDLGLASPFFGLPLGMTDGNGSAGLSIPMPTQGIPGLDLNAQAVTIGFTIGRGMPTLSVCTSDVESFHIGA